MSRFKLKILLFAYIPPMKVNTCSTLQRSLRSRDMIKATKTVNFSWQRLGIFSAFTHVFLKSPKPANSLTTKKLTVKEYSISRGEKLEGVFNFSISSPEWKQLRWWQFSPLVHTIDIRDIERKFFLERLASWVVIWYQEVFTFEATNLVASW